MKSLFPLLQVVTCFLFLASTVHVAGHQRRKDPNGESSSPGTAHLQSESQTNHAKIRAKGNPRESTDTEGRKHRIGKLELRDFDKISDATGNIAMQPLATSDVKHFGKQGGENLVQDATGESYYYYFGESNNGTSLSTLSLIRHVTPEGQQIVAGTVQEGNMLYQIREVANNEVISEEISQFDFEPEMEVGSFETEQEDIASAYQHDLSGLDQIDLPENSFKESSAGRNLQPDDGSILDVLVIYTKGAMCSAAGYKAGALCSATNQNRRTIESLIHLAIEESNQAFLVSSIPTRLRLVKMHFDLEYDDYENGWETTLSSLRKTNDGVLDYVHAMRTLYGADFVAMLVDTPNYCGMGYRPSNPDEMYAFSLTKWNCATGYYSFAHELGHNMGCNHDREHSSGSGFFNYNYGYQDPSHKFRTIMSYNCPGRSCPRVMQFSNPKTEYDGMTTGAPFSNNAQWIREHLSTYASFRTTTQPYLQLVSANLTGSSGPPAQSPAMGQYVQGLKENILVTSMTGGYIGAPGNMFDVVAKKNLTVTTFAVHSDAVTIITVEVWKKKTIGSYIGLQHLDSNDWEKMGTVTVTASPVGEPTVLPGGFMTPVPVKSGEIQSFYVTFQGNTNYNRYTKGTELGSIFSENDDIAFLEGTSNEYNFGGSHSPRVFNGAIYYEQGIELPSPGPSKKPANGPSLANTQSPTDRPSGALSRNPTAQPSQDPTVHPSKSSSSIPSSIPSLAPFVGNGPSKSIQTTFANRNGSYGSMFDVRAKKNLYIHNLQFHTNHRTPVDVEVYKLGEWNVSHLDNNDVPHVWQLVGTATVMGQGLGKPTSMPHNSLADIFIPRGSMQALYVTLIGGGLRYTNDDTGDIDNLNKDDFDSKEHITNNDLIIYKGSGVAAPRFGGSFYPRLWNGGLEYYEYNAPTNDKQQDQETMEL